MVNMKLKSIAAIGLAGIIAMTSPCFAKDKAKKEALPSVDYFSSWEKDALDGLKKSREEFDKLNDYKIRLSDRTSVYSGTKGKRNPLWALSSIPDPNDKYWSLNGVQINYYLPGKSWIGTNEVFHEILNPNVTGYSDARWAIDLSEYEGMKLEGSGDGKARIQITEGLIRKDGYASAQAFIGEIYETIVKFSPKEKTYDIKLSKMRKRKDFQHSKKELEESNPYISPKIDETKFNNVLDKHEIHSIEVEPLNRGLFRGERVIKIINPRFYKKEKAR